MRPSSRLLTQGSALVAGTIGAVLMHMAPARAAPVLDQDYYSSFFNQASTFSLTTGQLAGFMRAETFTVGIGGTLTEVDVNNVGDGTFSGVDILSTSGGVPTETVVDTGGFVSNTGGWAVFDVSLAVSVGEVLAIDPTGVTNNAWLGVNPGTYAGGGDYFLNPLIGSTSFMPSGYADYFRTYVSAAAARVPEPPSAAILAVALFGLAMRRKRRIRS